MLRPLRNYLALLCLTGCHNCVTPPPPPPSDAKSLAVVPHQLDIFVPDASKPVNVNLVAIVYGDYGRIIQGAPVTFQFPSPVLGVSLTNVSTAGDTMQLSILPCSGTCPPPDFSATITVLHDASGLTLDVPVQVTYGASAPHGVAADPKSINWPMVGLASGQAIGWQNNLLHPFVNRTGFGTFNNSVTPPAGDETSGSVLSSQYGLIRKTKPWGPIPFDVKVPSDGSADARGLPIKAFFAGSNFAGSQAGFLQDLQAGADIIEMTLVGVSVGVGSPESLPAVISWTEDCGTLINTLVTAGVPQSQQPSKTYLAVYMLKRDTPGDARAWHCGPGTLATSGNMATAQAILVPEAVVPAATIAHEIGHAFSLSHVSYGADYYDDNLMTETDDASAVLRSRFTVGQAFRAAIDPNSWLVIAGLTIPTSLDCYAMPLQCPTLAADAYRRVP